MFNIDWTALINNNTPMEWIKTLRITWLKVIISQIKINYNTFIQYRSDALYKLSFNAQIMNLRHILNDTFDNVNRGIYIDNVADLNRIYFYNKVEVRPPFYMYNNYNPLTSYAPGEYAVDGNKIYVAIAPSTGNLPSANPSIWGFYKNVVFFKNLIEYQNQYDYIVMVPATVTFDISAMKALVNYYNAAGKRYTIQTY